MTSISNPPIDDDIRTAAIARFGCADVSVFEQAVSDRSARGSDDAGIWYCLSTKPKAEDDWQVAARRRTKVELLQFLTT